LKSCTIRARVADFVDNRAISACLLFVFHSLGECNDWTPALIAYVVLALGMAGKI